MALAQVPLGLGRVWGHLSALLGISPHYKNEPRGHGGLRPHGVDMARLVTSQGGARFLPPTRGAGGPGAGWAASAPTATSLRAGSHPRTHPGRGGRENPAGRVSPPHRHQWFHFFPLRKSGWGGGGEGGVGASGTFRLGGAQVWTPPLPGGLGSRPPRPGGALPTPSQTQLPPSPGGWVCKRGSGRGASRGVCPSPPPQTPAHAAGTAQRAPGSGGGSPPGPWGAGCPPPLQHQAGTKLNPTEPLHSHCPD